MLNERPDIKVNWYRVRIDKETLRGLTQRSDWKGLLQTVGFLVLLILSGAAAFYAWRHLSVPVFCVVLFLHGTFFAFTNNAFHELVHGTVFRSKYLNAIFLRIFSFLAWKSHVAFYASHMRHHSYTLHPPDDSEVVLPLHLTLREFLLEAVVEPLGMFQVIGDTIRISVGALRGDWELTLFPKSNVEGRRRLIRWARITLLGHIAILTFSAITGQWLVALLISGARFYGGGLHYLCNKMQHVGLQDKVTDFRLCCRTVELNPFLQFLYFHMNYHTEHHMYAAVPCYNLGRLHRAIAHEMPPISHGLIPAWREIVYILKRQQQEPDYQHVYPLPLPSAS
jgi:fatty acid desaturase